MKNAFLETALVAAIVGAASAGVTTFFVSSGSAGGRGHAPEQKAVPVEVPESGPRPSSDPGLLSRLDELRIENRALIARIEALENRADVSVRVPVEVAPREEPEARTEAARGTPAENALLTPQLLGGVEAALARIRADERAEEELQRQQRKAQRIEERLSRLTDDLGLNPRQVGEMRTFLGEREIRQDELRERRELDDDRDSYREALARLRAENEATLARILTPTQLEGYLAREDDRENRDSERGRDDRGRRGERDG